MRDLKDTPPPLDSPTISDRDRESTAESTPITPVLTSAAHFGVYRRNKDRDLYFSWAKRPIEGNSAFLDSDILFEDTGDCSFPLFPDSPPQRPADAPSGMDCTAALDFGSPLHFSPQSPPTSNLTTALRGAAAGHQSGAINIGARNGNDGRLSVTGRVESSSNGVPSSYYGSGARQIPGGRENVRRESIASSFTNGMSWGGVSVGSWVRDDILMTGTSPYAFHQSPSFHSSSYLPKMEANFLRDYSCCGITLDSLHELLQHYEENHAQSSAHVPQRPAAQSVSGAAGPSARPTAGSSAISAGKTLQPSQRVAAAAQPLRHHSQAQRAPLSPVPDMDSLDDMELDEHMEPPTPVQQNFGFQTQASQAQPFQQTTPHVPPLNMNLANTMQQGFRSSNPSTPASAAQQGFQFSVNNPTVSSVNTPVFATPTSASESLVGTPQQQDFSDSNFLRTDFSNLNLKMPFDANSINMMMQQDRWPSLDFGLDATGNLNPMSNMTIDEPAKRLYSKTGGQMTQQQLQYALRTGQLGSDDSVQKLIAQQMVAKGTTGALLGEPESKPFRCPVIGCEKAYKNQNGLKYHKQHGHQNQKLKSNQDGSFSIVDPVTSIPYPGTQGMEKEKPFQCQVCDKRYKNPNGLKYHRQHSPPCNPDLKVNLPNLSGLAVNANVAGAGLMGNETGTLY